MPPNKKNLIKTLIANASCGCGRPKLSHVHNPTPSPIPRNTPSPVPSSSSSSVISTDKSSPSMQNSDIKGSITVNSIAVVKDSDEPYEDFRHSMLQMIFENEIYSPDQLHQLLNCFLDLNSPSFHPLIIQVFTHISNDIISKHST